MAEDKNHEASSAVEVNGETSMTAAKVPSSLQPYTVTYDGTAKEYIPATQLSEIEGVQSVEVTYTGTTNAGVSYRSTTPPTEAGQYAVTVSLKAEDGYTLATSLLGSKITIERAPQSITEPPTIARITTSTVTVNPIAGAEYSGNNGATWQTSNSFTGLAPQTSFTVLVRLAETPNYQTSEVYSIPVRTIANTGLTYDIDFIQETISYNDQVVEISANNFYTSPVPSGSAVTPGLMLFARLVDNGSGSAGESNIINIPARPAAPDVSLNTSSYTISSTTGIEMSTDDGASWVACTDNMDVSSFGGSVLLVRYAATENSFRSNVTNIFVPTRSEAPALIVDLKTERVNTTSALEYSDNNGASWKPCTPDMSVASLAGETIMVRKKATSTTPASESAFLNIPARADIPAYNILMSAETLTSDAPFEYNLNGAWTKVESLPLSDLCGQTLLIQTAAGNGKFASNRVSVQVPLRGETPVVEIEESTLTINTAIGMEFSVDNGTTWNPASVNMDISAYDGMVMLVRQAVTETTFASASTAVRIRKLAAAPDIAVDMTAETVNTTTAMEYSTDGGNTWILASNEMSVSDLVGGTLEIRLCGTDKEFPSESVTVVIPRRNEAPEVEIDLKEESFTAIAGVEYSSNGGETWTAAPSVITESMYGTTLLFRNQATDTHFVSVSVPVALPARPDGPAVAFNMKTMTVNTDSTMEYSTDGGNTWMASSNGLNVSALQGKILYFRYAATKSTLASSRTALEIPSSASAPVASVDCMSEQLISAELTLEWSQDNGSTWMVSKVPMYVGDYAGREILFRVPATTEKPASASVPVTIPVRASIPNVDVDTVSETINTTPAMEYSLNGGLSWTPAPMNLDVSKRAGEPVLVRTAYTTNSFASLPLSVTVPARANRVEVSIDMDRETLNTTSGMDYSLDGGKTWTPASADLSVSGLTGSVVMIRSHGTEYQLASEAVSVAIPVRRTAPLVSADLRNGLFSVPDGVVFSNNSGAAWTAVPAAITDEMLGSTVLFRFPANGSQFASAAVTVTLPVRADGPTLVLDRDAMTVNTTANMEYAVGDVWLPAPANMDVSSFHGHTMKFRYAATDTTPASSITTLDIPAVVPVPVLSLNMTDELIISANGNEVLEYSKDNGSTWQSCVMPMEIGGFGGKVLLFRTPADGQNPCSDVVSARIPARSNVPEVSLNMEAESIVTIPAAGTEYSIDNGNTWVSGTPNASSLTGQTILIRVACTAENMASEPATVMIPNRKPAPALSVDMVKETVNTDSSMEVSVDGGRTWMLAGENMEVSGLTGSTMLLRYACTDTTFHSENTIVTIPVRQNAPVVSVNSGKFVTPDGTEFSSDGGSTWGQVPTEITDDLLGKTVLFRLPANEKNFASESSSVTLPVRADGPILSFDKENLTVNTDARMEYSADNGATWSKAKKNMSVANHLGEMLLFRYAATTSAPASSITALEIPAAFSAPALSLDTVNERISSSQEGEVLEYSADSGITWQFCTMPVEIDTFAGKTLLFRVPAGDKNPCSPAVTMVVPIRANVPQVSIDTDNETIVTDPKTGVEYSADSGETWAALTGSLDASGLLGQILLVRTACTDTMLRSENAIVTVPVRRDAPIVLISPDRFEIPDGVEFSADGGKTWGAVPSAITDDLLGKSVLFRFPADGRNFASKSSYVALPDRADGPILSLDEVNLTVNTNAGMEYSTDNGMTWVRADENMSVANLRGQTLQFRYAATAVMPASSVTVLEIPAEVIRPVLNLDMVNERIVSDKGNETLEYSSDNGITWKTVVMPMEIGDLCGRTLLFRTAGEKDPSGIVTILVPIRADAPAVSINMTAETVSTDASMEFSVDNGATWTPAENNLDVSGMTGGVLVLRYPCTDTMFRSESMIVKVPVRRDAPVVLATSEKFDVPNGAEFSADGGNTWGPAPSAITDDLLGKSVLFRFPADDRNFVSKITHVALPDRADGPTLSFNEENLTVNTDTSMEYSADNGLTWVRAEKNMSVAGLRGQVLQFRYAATAVMPASSVTTLEIPAEAAEPVKPVLSLDMVNEQIVSDKGNEILEYSSDNGITWKTIAVPMEVGSFCGRTLLFRTAGEKDPDGIVTISVPVRANVPAVSINTTEETISTDASMEFSVDNGSTWVPAEENMNVFGMTGSILVLRRSCTDTMFRSESVIVTIPVRREAPAVSVNSYKLNVPNGVEFSADDGKTWGHVPSAITDNLLGKTVLFRFPADDRNIVSKIAYVALPARMDGPVLSLDKENLTVNTDASMEYSADNGSTWVKTGKNMSVAGMLGKTLLFRYAAANSVPASSESTLVIPTRNPAPVVVVYNVSSYGRNDGIIKGVSGGMEYRKVGVAAWTQVPGLSIGYLAAGTYEIRYAAAETRIASESRFVTVFVDRNSGSDSGSWIPNHPGNPGNSDKPSGPNYPGYPSYPGHTGSGSPAGSINSSYTVKFNTNSGSKVNSQSVKKNGQVKEPASPVREGYVFQGWYADSKLTKPYDFDTKVRENLMLYAKWEKVSTDDSGENLDKPGYIEPTPVDPTPVEPDPVNPVPVEPTPLPVNPPAQTQSSILKGDSGISYVNGRSEGVFAPNLSITRGEVAVILYRLMSDEARASYYATSNDFNDVNGSAWYNEAISTLVQAGVLGGYGDGTFRPEQPVTRAELAAILVRSNGGSAASGSTGFTDTSGHWAEGYISSAVASGLVFGYEDSSFRPNQSVTRAESVAMINRMLMRSAMDSSASATVTFSDVQPSDWFYGDVMAAANGNIG